MATAKTASNTAAAMDANAGTDREAFAAASRDAIRAASPSFDNGRESHARIQ